MLAMVFASTRAAEASYLRLATGSPAVDAGNNDYLNNGTPDNTDDDIKTDAAGEMRIQGTAVDLGAYEGGVVAPPPAAPILRVTTTGAGVRDGSNWANAMTLQVALAASTTPGDQIWIAEGIYNPHPTDRTVSFTIPAGILVYGGFAGDEAALADRAGAATILSGDLLGDDGTRPVRPTGDRTAYNAALAVYNLMRDDNSNRVVTIAGADVTLDGLTITAGESDGSYAGLVSTSANTNVNACTFTDNRAPDVGGGALFGGTEATLTGCTFTGNEVIYGDGGGAWFTAGGATLTACTFTGNRARVTSGGAYFREAATLTGCTFTGNEVIDGNGGGAAFRGAATLTACTFTGNEAYTGGGGAAFGGVATLTACTFTGNEADQGGGGAEFREAATLTNCVLVGNSIDGGNGGGIWFNSGGTVINSTLYNNTGRGIVVGFNSNNPFILQNSILVGNTATGGGNQVSVNNTDAANVVRIQNNLIAGGADPMGTDQGVGYQTPGSANITQTGTVDAAAATVFASTDAMNADYLRLKAGSPAVNAGNNAYIIPTGIMTDVAGRPRILARIVDLGAYESGMGSPELNICRVTTEGIGDGSSWAQAMSLQAALASTAFVPGDQIWIAGGIYKPHASDRTATFTIPAGVLVYGGFAGTENDDFDPATNDTRTRNAEGVLTNVTTLSGDLLGDDGTRPVRPPRGEDQTAYNVARATYDATRDDNSNTVVTLAGANVTLDGLTITAGQGGTDMNDHEQRMALGGAGLYAGAGTADATLTGCTFTNNEANNAGGAWFVEAATLTACTFTGNEALIGGGGGAFFREAATLTGCTFTGNEAEGGGGASFGGTATLTGCTFTGNEASGESDGGGGAWFNGVATLTACTFTGNTAGRGGGASFVETATLTNCVFAGNTADDGGGLFLRSGGTVINSTLYNNTAGGQGGGIWVQFNTNNPFILQNSILVGNTTIKGANQVYVNNTDAAHVAILQNNLIEGGATSQNAGIVYTGSGNITEANTVDAVAAAVFASTVADNANFLRLSATSPAVNAGNNAYLNNGTPANTEDDIKTDAAGRPRILGETVDLGAYESGMVPLAALNIRRVTTTGAGNESGSSWANASQLQAQRLPRQAIRSG